MCFMLRNSSYEMTNGFNSTKQNDRAEGDLLKRVRRHLGDSGDVRGHGLDIPNKPNEEEQT